MTPTTARPAEDVDLDPGRRADVEAELTGKYHVAWTYRTGVPATAFDSEKSLANQARFEALDEPTVEQYREAALRGDLFPAVIAHRPRKNGRLVVIDGNHRLAAFSGAGLPLNVYEIAAGTRAQTVMLMTFAFNTRHGRPTLEAERVHQALYLIDNGASVTVAAGAVNLPERIVKRELQRRNAEERARAVGVDPREWDTLTAGVRHRLLTVSTDEGFKDAAHLAFAAKLGHEEVNQLISTLNTSKSAAKQRALVKTQTAELHERIQDGGGGVLRSSGRGSGLTPKARLGMALAQIAALPDDGDVLARTYADTMRAEAATAVLQAAETLRKIAYAIDPSQA